MNGVSRNRSKMSAGVPLILSFHLGGFQETLTSVVNYTSQKFLQVSCRRILMRHSYDVQLTFTHPQLSLNFLISSALITRPELELIAERQLNAPCSVPDPLQ